MESMQLLGDITERLGLSYIVFVNKIRNEDTQ